MREIRTKKYLFLDDERIPSDVTWILIGGVGHQSTEWIVVRSYDDAVAWVLKNGVPDVISFDHDLGYEDVTMSNTGLAIVTDAAETKSGHDFAKFLVDHDMNTRSMPSNFSFTVHSMNPTGAKNIQSLLDNYLKFREVH